MVSQECLSRWHYVPEQCFQTICGKTPFPNLSQIDTDVDGEDMIY